MKTFFSIVLLLAVALLSGCDRKPQKVQWEYKTVIADSDPANIKAVNEKSRKESEAKGIKVDAWQTDGGERFTDYALRDFPLFELGREGWELVSAVPQTETVWPILKKSYTDSTESKIPNVRTSRIILIFKRPLSRS